MEKEENVAPESVDSVLKSCPYCGSNQLWRIQRTELEKIICYLSNGRYAVKKYLCKACERATLLQRDNRPHSEEELLLLENNALAIFIPCNNCGSEKMKISGFIPEEANTYLAATGKTAFKKLCCLNCKSETIISREDYLAANNNEV